MPLLTAAEYVARYALRSRGVRSVRLSTDLGPVHAFVGRGAGTLPKVVFLHGIAGSGGPFAPVALAIQSKVREFVMPDMPGHGWSPRPPFPLRLHALFDTMVDVIDRLIDEPAILVGNSLGGALALRFAHDRRQKVKAMVLLSPGGARLREEEIEEVQRTFNLRTRADAREFIDRLYHKPPPYSPLLVGGLHSRIKSGIVREILHGWSPADSAQPEQLAGIDVPVAIVWGKSDRILPPSAREYFRTHVPPNVEFHEPDHIGHVPHLEDPRYVAKRVLEIARAVS